VASQLVSFNNEKLELEIFELQMLGIFALCWELSYNFESIVSWLKLKLD
jgi:hypothetical protein